MCKQTEVYQTWIYKSRHWRTVECSNYVKTSDKKSGHNVVQNSWSKKCFSSFKWGWVGFYQSGPVYELKPV